jgi:hypothetical protein
VEAVAADEAAFAAASGDPALAAQLAAGAVLSRTSALLRDVVAGGSLTLLDGITVPVTAVVDDAAIGGYEAAVGSALGQQLGLTRTATRSCWEPTARPRRRWRTP